MYFLLSSLFSQNLLSTDTLDGNPLYPIDSTLPSLFKMQDPTFLYGSSDLKDQTFAVARATLTNEGLFFTF